MWHDFIGYVELQGSMRVLVLLITALIAAVHSNVISIDFGEEAIKIAIIGYSMPMGIVLNGESKRTTENIISIRNNERQFGSEAAATSLRYPASSYSHLKLLLGKLFDSAEASKYRSLFSNGMVKDEKRGTVMFEDAEYGNFSVEELIAMMFSNAQAMTKAHTNRDAYDCVITVPGYYNLFERQAIIDGAKIAGLRVLEIVNELTAASLYFATTHAFSTNVTRNMFVDIGAGSVAASIASFYISEVTENNKTISNHVIEVHSIGYDDEIGGFEIDRRLKDFLVAKFTAKYKNASLSAKAHARLLKESREVKKLLNTIPEATVNIESLWEDYGLNVKVSRADLESLIEDWDGRLEKVVETALSHANLTMDDLQNVILLGGTSRVLKVNAIMKEIAKDKLAMTMNTEESIVFGGVLRAAELSKRFKLKQKFTILDHVQPLNSTNSEEDSTIIPAMTAEEIESSQAKLNKLNEAEKRERERATLRNDVESFVYAAREHLDMESYSKFTTSEESQKLTERMSQIMDLLDISGDSESTENLSALKKELSDLAKPLYHRKEELENREKMVPAFNQLLQTCSKYLNSTLKIAEDERGPTDADLTNFSKMVSDSEDWIAEKTEAQAKLPLAHDPAFLTSEIQLKTFLLETEMRRLKAIKKKRKPVVVEEKKSEEVPAKEEVESNEKKEEVSKEERKDEVNKDEKKDEPVEGETKESANNEVDSRENKNESNETGNKENQETVENQGNHPEL